MMRFSSRARSASGGIKIDRNTVEICEAMSFPRGNMKLAVWEAFKVYDGGIHAVEAFMKVIAPGVGSGWTAEPRPTSLR